MSLEPLKTTSVRRLLSLSLLYCLCLCLTSSCSTDPATHLMADYHYRLNNALRTNLPYEPISTPIALFPSKREIRKKTERYELGLLDFLKLSSCELQRHIGHRNSSLGKVMPDSLLWEYDITFIHLAHECLPTLTSNPKLRQDLETAMQVKINNLPQVAWNASVAGPEFQNFFSTSTQSLSKEMLEHESTSLLVALENINQLFQPLHQLKSTREIPSHYDFSKLQNRLEAPLEVLHHSQYMGQLLHSVHSLTLSLNQSTTLFENTVSKKVCLNGSQTPQLNIVLNVFKKYYLGEVQPYVARIHQQGELFLFNLENLAKTLSPTPDRYTEYWSEQWQGDNIDSTWSQFETSIKNHTEAWQAFFSKCRVPVQQLRP